MLSRTHTGSPSISVFLQQRPRTVIAPLQPIKRARFASEGGRHRTKSRRNQFDGGAKARLRFSLTVYCAPFQGASCVCRCRPPPLESTHSPQIRDRPTRDGGGSVKRGPQRSDEGRGRPHPQPICRLSCNSEDRGSAIPDLAFLRGKKYKKQREGGDGESCVLEAGEKFFPSPSFLAVLQRGRKGGVYRLHFQRELAGKLSETPKRRKERRKGNFWQRVSRILGRRERKAVENCLPSWSFFRGGESLDIVGKSVGDSDSNLTPTDQPTPS